MNQSDCLAPDQVDRVVGLPPDHAVSRHVRECPRCSALVLEYRDFLAATDVPAGADLADASRRLAGTIASLRPEASAGVAAPSPLRQPSVLERIVGWWAGPARGPALAFAAIAIVAAGWWSLRSPAPLDDAVRGGGGAARPMIELRAMATGSDALVLGWSAVPSASVYSITLLDASLEPLAELPLTADTTASLARSQWPATSSGDTLYLRIEALHDAQIVAISALHPIVLQR